MYIFEHAVSPESRATAFRLRYEVYCNEKQWLDPDKYPDMQEYDDDDDRSEIFLAYDSETGKAVGTTRLIINKRNILPLPVIKHPAVNGNLVTDNSVEISRFSILKGARSGNIFIGLIRMLFQHILDRYSSCDYIFFSVEERFLDKVNQLGFEFIPFAPSALWYCDLLIPSRQIIPEMDACLSRNNPQFHKWLWQDSQTMSNRETLMSFLRTNKTNLPGKNNEIQ